MHHLQFGWLRDMVPSRRARGAAVAGCLLLLTAGFPHAARAADRPAESKPAIRTFFVTRALTDERLMPYLKEARPQVVQIGNYGAMFHGYADNRKSTGWPMRLPVAGEQAALDYQRKLNAQVHDLGLTVVGHFRLTKVMGHWKEQSGFVDYYNNRWPTRLLGPRPHADLIDLLQRDGSGEPIQLGRYEHAQLAFCLSSPHARQMFKQMLKVAVDQQIDGVITTYNYRFSCACPHCQSAFKSWLKVRLTPAELKERLGIDDLEQHVFDAIPARIPGYPAAESATELDWLASRWGSEHFKRMYDEIFLDYGRTLKPDLLVAQWNHLGHVGLSEERNFLPRKMWGRGENYFWYSGGASFVGKNLNLSDGKAGDAWLSCLYVRALGGGKPFVIGKYDRVRLEASMAEGYATGGMGMGRYMRFSDPVGYEVLVRYTRFMHDHRDLYDGAAPHADAALILPRQSVLNRRPAALDVFRQLGQALLERQVLLDVVVDEQITDDVLARYPAVILPGALALSDGQLAALRGFATDGGTVLLRGEVAKLDERGRPRQSGGIEGAIAIDGETAPAAADAVAARLRQGGGSVIESPWTVRASAYARPGRVILHLVNYDREEGAPEANRSGPATERPQPVENVSVALRIPAGRTVTGVTLHAPERDETVRLPFEQQQSRVRFTVPRLRVYGVIAIDTKATPR